MSKYFAHETVVIDDGAEIAEDVKIWHFTHIMPDCKIERGCNIGQNCVIFPKVVLGENVKNLIHEQIINNYSTPGLILNLLKEKLI